MTIKVRITFASPRGLRPILSVVNGQEVPFEALTVGDLTDKIAEAEKYLSRLTGLIVRIETGAE